MGDIPGSLYYRRRAAQMRDHAANAEAEHLRSAFSMLAYNWDQLAEQAETRQLPASDNCAPLS